MWLSILVSLNIFIFGKFIYEAILELLDVWGIERKKYIIGIIFLLSWCASNELLNLILLCLLFS